MFNFFEFGNSFVSHSIDERGVYVQIDYLQLLFLAPQLPFNKVKERVHFIIYILLL